MQCRNDAFLVTSGCNLLDRGGRGTLVATRSPDHCLTQRSVVLFFFGALLKLCTFDLRAIHPFILPVYEGDDVCRCANPGIVTIQPLWSSRASRATLDPKICSSVAPLVSNGSAADSASALIPKNPQVLCLQSLEKYFILPGRLRIISTWSGSRYI